MIGHFHSWLKDAVYRKPCLAIHPELSERWWNIKTHHCLSGLSLHAFVIAVTSILVLFCLSLSDLSTCPEAQLVRLLRILI